MSLPMRPRLRCHSPAGLTLIEMLISVVLTLMLVFALVRVFELFGTNVRDSRAIMDLAGKLRVVSTRLQNDLDGMTALSIPNAESNSSAGYFEYFEGPGSDRDANNNGNVDALDGPDTDFLPDEETHVGDADDVLMFTSRSTGNPFRGRALVVSKNKQVLPPPLQVIMPAMGTPPITLSHSSIESDTAEIAWWSAIYDRNDNQLADINEPRVLMRKALLVRRDIDLSAVPAQTPQQVTHFFLHNDISARWIDSNNDGSRDRLVANSLADLSKRENRFGRHNVKYVSPNLFDVPQTNSNSLTNTNLAKLSTQTHNYPNLHEMAVEILKKPLTGYLINPLGVLSHLSHSPSATTPIATIVESDLASILELTDMLAFDVRAYDPQAPLSLVQLNPTTSLALVPGDPGYTSPNFTTRGAFVDLGYLNEPPADTLTPPQTNTSVFSGLPSRGSRMWWSGPTPLKVFVNDSGNPTPVNALTYDTWSVEYERDGIDQDTNNLIDQGNDGLDTDNQFGVDDPQESETVPPYPTPLRGIQITIRAMDFSTRQVRQVSIVSDMMSE